MKKHILLIDDDYDELMIFTDALKEIDGSFTCTYASSADQAIEKLKHLTPDVIFIDFNLPKINGLQLLSVFNDDQKHRVYLYSTRISEEVKKMAKLLGAAGCIEKTNTITDLAQQLRIILYPALLPRYVFSAKNRFGDRTYGQ